MLTHIIQRLRQLPRQRLPVRWVAVAGWAAGDIARVITQIELAVYLSQMLSKPPKHRPVSCRHRQTSRYDVLWFGCLRQGGAALSA